MIIYKIKEKKIDRSWLKHFKEFVRENGFQPIMLTTDNDNLTDMLFEKMAEVGNQSEHYAFVCVEKEKRGDEAFLGGKVSLPILIYPRLSLFLVDEIKANSVLDFFTEWSEKARRVGLHTVTVYANEEEKKEYRMLLYMDRLSTHYNGTAVVLTGTYEGLLNNKPEWLKIDVCVSKQALLFHNLHIFDECEYLEKEEISKHYDIGCFFYQLTELDAQIILDNHCDKWVSWPLDVIGFRCNYGVKSADYLGFVRMMKYSDYIFYLSNASKNDISTFLEMEHNSIDAQQQVLYLPGRQCQFIEKEKYVTKCYFNEYILVVGNNLPHKMIDVILPHLCRMSFNFIVIGGAKSGLVSDRVYCYRSGGISAEFLDYLYENAVTLIYPSVYEGLGLPILQALNCGKDVIVTDSEVNHELEKLHPLFVGHIHYMHDYAELAELILEIKNSRILLEKNLYNKNWNNIGLQMLDAITKELHKEVDRRKIEKRHQEYYFLLKNNNVLREVSVFFAKKEKVYIYGAGVVAKRCLGMLKTYGFQPSGFVVTECKTKEFCALPVIPFQQIVDETNYGVVLGMNRTNSKEVEDYLSKLHYQDYICVEIL